MRFTLAALCLSAFLPAQAIAQDRPTNTLLPFDTANRYSCGKTCGQVRSCDEAVYQWCACNYRRADGDNDGVPCEKHCGQGNKSNRAKVSSIKQKLGC